jgi:hypothetical protein
MPSLIAIDLAPVWDRRLERLIEPLLRFLREPFRVA